MRYRLLSFQARSMNNISAEQGTYKPVGDVKIAETPEEALEAHNPVAGRWLVLCEDDHTWRIFHVTKRTETDIAPADEDASAIAAAVL